MDRFTWAAVVGVVALCVVAILTVVVPRADERPPDLSTPDGVVTAYIAAIRDKRADDAWALLDSPASVALDFAPRGTDDTRSPQDAFRLQVNNNPRGGDRRVRIAEVRITGDTARVDVEITMFSGGAPLFGPSSYSSTVTFNLKRVGASWRITSSPSIYLLG